MAEAPSEDHVSRKWDTCIESMFKNTAAGLAGGALFGFLLFRSTPARVAATVAPASFLAGTSWSSCEQTFRHGLVSRIPMPGQHVATGPAGSDAVKSFVAASEGCPVQHKSS